ncbi:tetratricopeptide repeat protein [Treponema sp. C6A8]|uniref:tetratricopeptide repeat protein n=1 Tax=Treponema sp. C6A8 TaxID=1410609 RepID=UPI0006854088|nr:tetratricopeptide repeat protein [Treponema sp. C6A8]
MAEIEVKPTASSKAANFLEKNKKGLVTVLVAAVVILVAYIIFVSVSSSFNAKNLQKIDEISYALTNGSAGLSDDELAGRRTKALEDLASFVKNSGVSGVRANLLAADIAYQAGNKEDAVAYWKAAAKAGKKAYTAPIAYFNIASAYEDLDKLDDAAANYKLAADNKDFVMRSHAAFNYGRVLEAQGKYAEAVEAYTKLNDELPDDTFAKLAKTRIIQLKLEGKAE